MIIHQGSLALAPWLDFRIYESAENYIQNEEAHFPMRRSQCFHQILKGVYDLNKVKDHCNPLGQSSVLHFPQSLENAQAEELFRGNRPLVRVVV